VRLFKCLLLQLKARSLRSGARTLLEVIAMQPSGFAALSSWTRRQTTQFFCKIRQKIGAEKLVVRFSIFSKGSFRPKDTWGKSLPFVDALSPHFQSKSSGGTG